MIRAGKQNGESPCNPSLLPRKSRAKGHFYIKESVWLPGRRNVGYRTCMSIHVHSYLLTYRPGLQVFQSKFRYYFWANNEPSRTVCNVLDSSCSTSREGDGMHADFCIRFESKKVKKRRLIMLQDSDILRNDTRTDNYCWFGLSMQHLSPLARTYLDTSPSKIPQIQ